MARMEAGTAMLGRDIVYVLVAINLNQLVKK